MVKGTACDNVRQLSTMTDNFVTVMYTVTAFSGLLCFFGTVIYWWKRNHVILKASSPLFLIVANIGGLVLCVAVILALQTPSATTCMGFMWCLVFGYCLTVGSLFLKTYRISAIFNNRTLKVKRNISNKSLVSYMIILLFVEAIIMIIFQAVSPLELGIEIHGGWLYYQNCSSPHQTEFASVLLVMNFGLLICAAYVAYRTRNVDEVFSESAYLFAAIQNITVVVGVTFVCYFAVLGDSAYPTRIFLMLAVINFLVISTHGILLASKLHALREYATTGKTFETTRPLDTRVKQNPIMPSANLSKSDPRVEPAHAQLRTLSTNGAASAVESAGGEQ